MHTGETGRYTNAESTPTTASPLGAWVEGSVGATAENETAKVHVVVVGSCRRCFLAWMLCALSLSLFVSRFCCS